RGPPGADRRRPDLAMGEQPAVRVVIDLVAALVVEPAVVTDRDGEHTDRGPLHEHEQGDHLPRLHDVEWEPAHDGACPCEQAGTSERLGADRHYWVTATRRDAVYQAIVRSSPSRSGVRARKPKSSSARVVSRRR